MKTAYCLLFAIAVAGCQNGDPSPGPEPEPPGPERPDLSVEPAPSPEPAPAPRRAPDVEPGVLVGEITALRHDTASINLGRAQGLTPGIELPVRRGALRIATLQIERVEIVSAAGILIDQEFSPRRGDVVLFEPPVESDGE